jgi:hypothetical protein
MAENKPEESCMRAKIRNGKIVWVDSVEEYLPYEAFLEMKCTNPRAADDSIYSYYDHYFGSILKQWEDKGKPEFSSAIVFGDARVDFIGLLNDYIQARDENEHFGLEILLYDWTRFIQDRDCCHTRYDIFVEIVRELAKVLK